MDTLALSNQPIPLELIDEMNDLYYGEAGCSEEEFKVHKYAGRLAIAIMLVEMFEACRNDHSVWPASNHEAFRQLEDLVSDFQSNAQADETNAVIMGYLNRAGESLKTSR